MDIRQLRYFIAVVEEKHFSKAANLLHISQPSLSTAIMKLEKDIGIQLLERNTRGFKLTESGEIFYTRSLELINKYEHMLKELDDLRQKGNGIISIGLIESAKYWLPKIIINFKNSFPDIHFQFKEILGEKKVFQTLANYDVHCTITNQPIQFEEIEIVPIYTEDLVLVIHKADELNKKSSISLEDLSERDFIICKEGFQTREDVLRAFQHENVTPDIKFEIERLETACSLIEHGLGITILPESYIKYNSNPNIVTHTLPSQFLKRTVYFAYWKDRNLSPAVFELLASIKDFFIAGNSLKSQ
ncbi:LysR family transcriptional regulator [Mesobacillus zeae]|uniref:LysR family transcriptional regulator n=1 Tax=Mesobacillus zeae TaxID=1917180 RepID=UPI00300BC778